MLLSSKAWANWFKYQKNLTLTKPTLVVFIDT